MRYETLFARYCRTLVAFAMVAAMVASTAMAQPPSPAPDQIALLREILSGSPVDGSIFADSFTAQVPATKVRSIVEDYRARLGDVATIGPAGAGTDYLITFAHGTLLATMQLNWNGKISGLLFHDEVSEGDRAALERFFSASAPRSEWFAPSFLTQVPMTQILATTSQIVAQEGPYKRLVTRDGVYYAVFEKFQNHVSAQTDAQGRFVALLLRAPEALGA